MPPELAELYAVPKDLWPDVQVLWLVVFVSAGIATFLVGAGIGWGIVMVTRRARTIRTRRPAPSPACDNCPDKNKAPVATERTHHEPKL